MKTYNTLSRSFLSIALLLGFTLGQAQNKIVLQEKKYHSSKRTLKFDREYTIKTCDTTYTNQIIGYTDSTLLMAATARGKDTTYIAPKPFRKGYDTVVAATYVKDTAVIMIADIEYIQKPFFKDRGIANIGWEIEKYSFLGLLASPIEALVEGKEKGKEMAVVSGIGMVVGIPFIIIGEANTKFDLKNRWEIVKAQENVISAEPLTAK